MAARRRRSPLTGFVVLGVVAVLVALGLVLGDRYVEQRVEREAAAQLQAELGSPAPPAVDVEGWPFLTQVVAQRLPRVHVVADDLGADGGTAVPVAHADLLLTDVTTPDWFRTLEAARVEGTARLDYDALGALAGVPLAPAGGGRVQLERTTSLFGAEVKATVTGLPRLDPDAQTLTLTDPTIDVAGVTLPQTAADALLRAVVQPIPVRGLPLGLRVISVTAGDDAVDVGLLGEDVELSR
ncbi:DUF2993 domain-containing protein [Microlunatus capsulatus]|uniref:DUF2993 domain-containing protein n=1 Tax=Microlunatus capsulatus TaxID=99117 RepID=A0ABS4ZCW0_9ACTN|nr:DUF2993 domain-containing protein [Microlunatus capsulatus]MBP2418605.1 hypothetical protein [Microlunatus capsulatus]